MSGAGVRVSIPSSVRKTIQNIKEITGNHSEEEIYAMLRECFMDPNETAQKLLFQDTFHEVKRKRERRKETVNNKESGDSHWRSGMQVQLSRGGRVNFAPHYTSRDAGGGRKSGPGKDNGTIQTAENGKKSCPRMDNGTIQTAESGTGPSLSAFQEKKQTSLSASSAAVVANGPSGAASGSTGVIHASNLPAGNGVNQHEVISSCISVNKLGRSASPVDVDKSPTIEFETRDIHGELPSSLASVIPVSSSTVCFSSKDPVPIPSNDSRPLGTIKCEFGSHQTVGQSNSVIPAENLASEVSTSLLQGKMPSKSQGVGNSQFSESSHTLSTLVYGGSSSRRPSSSYNIRLQQTVGPQKVGSNKEWKPKPLNTNVPQGSETVGSSNVPNKPVEAIDQSQHTLIVLDSEEAIFKLQSQLEELHLPQRQHVIIPNHIHVPESERTKLNFGSFDGIFGVTSSHTSGPESDKSSTPLSETSQVIEETVEEHAASYQNGLVTTEEEAHPDHSLSPSHVHGNLSDEGIVSSGTAPDNESKQETALLSGGNQYTVVHTSPSYSFGFVPPVLGGQIPPFEHSESQARDASELPGFVVQPPLDPMRYYAQFYRSGADNEGRVSPFPSAAIASKYNGNVAVLPSHTSQSPQEGGNSLVPSTTGQTPAVTQAAGLMQSSIPVTQQPVHVFRPTALHISHYPPNYVPYGHYFSPFYAPSPGIHQFLSNGTFPQQPQAGSLFPAPPAAAATGVKYSVLQYKPGNNVGNSTHIGMPGGYGPYGSSLAGYNPSSAATGGNTTANEDLGTLQFKESNVYITGQQSEGSPVWIAAAGRDTSTVPESSYYSLPSQGPHATFAPTQAAHGTFASIYHPAQAVTAAAVHPLLQQSQARAGALDMVGPAASVYQHQQINWPGAY